MKNFKKNDKNNSFRENYTFVNGKINRIRTETNRYSIQNGQVELTHINTQLTQRETELANLKDTLKILMADIKILNDGRAELIDAIRRAQHHKTMMQAKEHEKLTKIRQKTVSDIEKAGALFDKKGRMTVSESSFICDLIRELTDDHGYTIAELADLMNKSDATIYKYYHRKGQEGKNGIDEAEAAENKVEKR